jgi:hydroxypyruvate isomerase
MDTRAYTVNCSILLTDLPLLQRPQAARDAGFDAVEFWWPFDTPVPSDAQVDTFVGAIQDAGVQLTGLNFAAGDMPAGDRGLLSDPAHTAAFRDNIDVTVGIGMRLGTKAFNALYGNRVEGVAPEQQDELAAENLALAGRAAAGIGGVVLIEPVSGSPAYPLKLAADAAAVIERVRSDHRVDALRLLADLYHLQVNGDDIAAALEKYRDLIGHVQIADAPGRGEPGTGTLDLDRYLAQLADGGYTGYIGLEYKATRADTFDWIPRSERASRPATV